ncbi:beta-mannosidase [Paenibacillus koleovorans]|uniref:beta-mannosidase n=1 Tax=Paenibacillus koleovorans TaxID=121608 RepID=UPI000FDC5341|nr:sugar-binding domain-containing protein [Paenibacillus koleovorans]
MKCLELNGEWELTWTEPEAQPQVESAAWYPAQVPGEVHLDLYRAGVIPDPYFGTNFFKCEWMEKSDFWYRKTFHLPEDFVDTRMLLKFEGLDTFATIWVNGSEVAQTRNMFIPYEFEIGEHLQAGASNTITVRLSGPISFVKRGVQFPHLPIDVSRVPVTFNMPWRLYSRKMQMSYGWDNVPRMVTTGIFRPVQLWSYAAAKIEDLHLVSRVEERDATVSVSFKADVPAATASHLTAHFHMVEEDGKLVAEANLTPDADGVFRMEAHIAEAKLWWPFQLGKPHLHQVKVTLRDGDRVLDERQLSYGIRSVRVVTEPATKRIVDYRIGTVDNRPVGMDGGFIRAWGKVPLDPPQEVDVHPFRLEINGQPIFIKGVNWQPADNFLPNVSGQKYEILLRRVREANLNLVRIWGGGVPEDDRFFDLCDRLGIFVWQDFFFACALYPQDDWFVNEVEAETIAVIKRLRNRTSLIIWCGDNEGDMANFDRGNDPIASNRITHQLIPSLVHQYDSTRYYHPSSPSGGGYPRAPWAGDKRNWGAFYPHNFYEHIRSDEGVFISEGGSYSLPSMRSIEASIPEGERWPVMGSESWYYHLGNVPGTYRAFESLMDSYISQYFGKPETLEEYIWLSQYAQGNGYKAFVEHFRSRKYDCGGFAIWKYTDAWPCGCMTLVDYHLTNKISFYYTKRASSPVLLSLKYAEDRFEVWVINDELRPVQGIVSVEAIHNQTGDAVLILSQEATVTADCATLVNEIMLTDLAPYDKHSYVLRARMTNEGSIVSQNLHYLDDIIRYSFPKSEALVTTNQTVQGQMTITVEAQTFIRNVEIDLPAADPANVTYSDNHFPMFAGEKAVVTVVVSGATELGEPVVKCR